MVDDNSTPPTLPEPAPPAGNPNSPDKPPIGQATQFKPETATAHPNHHSNGGSNKPWSVRNALRHLAAQEIDPSDPDAIKALTRGRKMSIAETIALRALTKAVVGDMRAVEYATDSLDGKLPQSTINADLAKITNMSDDEIRAELADGLARMATLAVPSTGSGTPRDNGNTSPAPATADTAAGIPGAVGSEKA